MSNASAFPTPNEVDEDGMIRSHSQRGMTKREYAAIHIAACIAATYTARGVASDDNVHEDATTAVKLADAVLAELEKSK